MADSIRVERLQNDQVVRLTLNAPKGNVLDSTMMTALQSELDKLKSSSQTKLIEFVGEGAHFSFGASVEEHTKENAPAMLKQFHQLFFTLTELAIPTASLVSGQCLGGGMELALICNFIFVDTSAKMGQPEIALAVFPPPASLILPMKIGQSHADDLLLTGRVIDADEAYRIGLVHEIFDDKESMLSSVDQWAEKNILSKSGSSLRFANRTGRYDFNRRLINGLQELEKIYVDELMATHDANEGITSFLERRKPVWKDC